MRKILIKLGAITLLVCVSSCTHRLTDFTVMSTKNVPLGKNTKNTFAKANTRVKAKDTAHSVLIFPLGMPNMKEAIDRAIESYPGAVGLVDGVVKSCSWNIIIYEQRSYIVEGTPLYETEIKEEIEPITEHQTKHEIKQHNEKSEDTEELEDVETMLFFHEVKDGETLASIAKEYDVSVKDIIKWNKLNSTRIVKGDKLRILMK